MESCASLLGSVIANFTNGPRRLAINAPTPATHLSARPRSVPGIKARCENRLKWAVGRVSDTPDCRDRPIRYAMGDDRPSASHDSSRTISL